MDDGRLDAEHRRQHRQRLRGERQADVLGETSQHLVQPLRRFDARDVGGVLRNQAGDRGCVGSGELRARRLLGFRVGAGGEKEGEAKS